METFINKMWFRQIQKVPSAEESNDQKLIEVGQV